MRGGEWAWPHADPGRSHLHRPREGSGSALRLISAARGRVTVPPMRPPRRDDALIAAALAGPSLVQVLVAPIAPRAVGVLIALAATAPIAWRRTYPAAAALAGTALWCLHTDGLIVLGYGAAFLLFYSLGAHDPNDRRVIAVCAFALVTGAIGTTQSHPVLYEYVTTFFIVVGPTAVGRLARRQREQAERLGDLPAHPERGRGCPTSPSTWSASGSGPPTSRSTRSGRGSLASCTTWSPTA